MRFLKTLTLNRRAIYDNRVAVTTANSLTLATTNNMVLPSSNNDLSGVQVEGMLRYNTTSHEVEVYSGVPAAWRQLRYKEPGKITQQNLGAGDSSTVYFGPLSPSPASYFSTQSNMTWDLTQMAKNVLVIVENVIQLSGTNYTIVQDPTIGSETYSATTSVTASSGANKLYFNSSINATGASGNGSTVTLTFPTQLAVPFAVGSTIIVTGFTPTGYNGTFTVSASTTSSVSYSSTAIAAMTFAGNITANTAVYPAVNIVGATVTGTNIPGGTTVTGYVTDPYTDALLNITLSNNTTGSVGLNAVITIAENARAATGYYLFFSSPPPYGKTVTALIGFDQ
jgi:hypothetical protein